jgi:hypothetical protein
VRIRVLEWIGLIMGDMLAFLVVGLAFLYTFTEPVSQATAAESLQEETKAQRQQIAKLRHTVQSLHKELAGKKAEKKAEKQSPSQAQVRLFPGGVLVYAPPKGEPYRLDIDGLVAMLRGSSARRELVLSAEAGVGYERLTGLAEDLMQLKGVAVRFGW